MLSYEKLSRRPESFRRPTGVDIDLFNGMTEKKIGLYRKSGEMSVPADGFFRFRNRIPEMSMIA